jgi:hypothetical protein
VKNSFSKKALLYYIRIFNLKVTYSDNDKQFIAVESDCIKKLSENKHTLETSINLPNLALTDSCCVKLCITMVIDEYNDIKEKLLEENHNPSDEAASSLSIAKNSENNDSAMIIDDSINLITAFNLNEAKINTGIQTTSNERRVVFNEKNFKNNNNSLSLIEISNYVKIFFEPLAKKFY